MVMKRTVVITDPVVIAIIDRYKENNYLGDKPEDDADAVEEMLLERVNSQVLDGGPYDGLSGEFRKRCVLRDRARRKGKNN